MLLFFRAGRKNVVEWSPCTAEADGVTCAARRGCYRSAAAMSGCTTSNSSSSLLLTRGSLQCTSIWCPVQNVVRCLTIPGLVLFVAHVSSSNCRCWKLCIFVLVTLCYVNRKKTLYHSHSSSNTHAPLHSFTQYHIHLPLPFSHTLYSHIAKVQTSLFVLVSCCIST